MRDLEDTSGQEMQQPPTPLKPHKEFLAFPTAIIPELVTRDAWEQALYN